MSCLTKSFSRKCISGLMLAWLTVAAATGTTHAQETGLPRKTERVRAEAHLSVDRLEPGKECDILIRLNIQPEWHINSNPPEPKEYVATEVTFKGKLGTKLGSVKYPKGKPFRMKGIDEPISVYEGRVDLFGKLSVPAGAAGKLEDMEIVVNFQSCNHEICELPATVKLSGKLPVAREGEAVRAINDKLFHPPMK